MDRQKIRERFMKNVFKDGEGHWWWTGPSATGRYGSFGIEGRTMAAHRVAYWLEHPDFDLFDSSSENQIDHVSQRREDGLDVNPANLERVTQAANMQRAWGTFAEPTCKAKSAPGRIRSEEYRISRRPYDRQRRVVAMARRNEILEMANERS